MSAAERRCGRSQRQLVHRLQLQGSFLGQQLRRGASDHLLCAPPVDALGGSVPAGDGAREVLAEDGIAGDLDDLVEESWASRQRSGLSERRSVGEGRRLSAHDARSEVVRPRGDEDNREVTRHPSFGAQYATLFRCRSPRLALGRP